MNLLLRIPSIGGRSLDDNSASQPILQLKELEPDHFRYTQWLACVKPREVFAFSAARKARRLFAARA